MRPDTYGPRSMTGTVTDLPLSGLRNVTMVPQGSVRLATPITALVSAMPQAVREPYRPGPYQLMFASKCQTFLGVALGLLVGWGTVGRAPATTAVTPASAKAVPGPSHPAERFAVSRVGGIDIAGDPEGDSTTTARNCAAVNVWATLTCRAPAELGPATRADAAMSAAIATMNLVRTMQVNHTRVVK